MLPFERLIKEIFHDLIRKANYTMQISLVYHT